MPAQRMNQLSFPYMSQWGNSKRHSKSTKDFSLKNCNSNGPTVGHLRPEHALLKTKTELTVEHTREKISSHRYSLFSIV